MIGTDQSDPRDVEFYRIAAAKDADGVLYLRRLTYQRRSAIGAAEIAPMAGEPALFTSLAQRSDERRDKQIFPLSHERPRDVIAVAGPSRVAWQDFGRGPDGNGDLDVPAEGEVVRVRLEDAILTGEKAGSKATIRAEVISIAMDTALRSRAGSRRCTPRQVSRHCAASGSVDVSLAKKKGETDVKLKLRALSEEDEVILAQTDPGRLLLAPAHPDRARRHLAVLPRRLPGWRRRRGLRAARAKREPPPDPAERA